MPSPITPNLSRKIRSLVSPKQRRFMEDCISTQRVFADVMEDHDVTPHQLVQWLLDRRFRRYLKQMRIAIREQIRMNVSIGANLGAALLNRQAQREEDGHKNERHNIIQCKAAAALIRLEQYVQTQEHRPAKPVDAEPTPPLVHPDHSEEEIQRLLNIVEGHESAD